MSSMTKKDFPSAHVILRFRQVVLTQKIKEFADENFQINLAVSLHAPNNDLRTRIMKINKAFPIEKLMDSIDYYLETTNRRITFEYIMLHGCE